MAKHVVNWKKVTFQNVVGENFQAEFPLLIEHYYQGGLLSQIVSMPHKKPIGFDDAIRMAGQRFFDSKIGHARGESHWYLKCFIQWVSELGYHIELTGDEFEAVVMPDKVA